MLPNFLYHYLDYNYNDNKKMFLCVCVCVFVVIFNFCVFDCNSNYCHNNNNFYYFVNSNYNYDHSNDRSMRFQSFNQVSECQGLQRGPFPRTFFGWRCCSLLSFWVALLSPFLRCGLPSPPFGVALLPSSSFCVRVCRKFILRMCIIYVGGCMNTRLLCHHQTRQQQSQHKQTSHGWPTEHPCPLRWGGCGLLTNSTQVSRLNEPK